VTLAGLWLAVVLGTEPGAAGVRPVTPSERAVDQVAKRLVAWLADPAPEAATALRQRVRAGVPPRALIVLLDRYRQRPRAELADLVAELAGYRRVDVRAHALAAWAETGGRHADLAIAAASRDLERSIRRLAIAIAKRHPSPAADVYIGELLARDEVLAKEVEAAEADR